MEKKNEELKSLRSNVTETVQSTVKEEIRSFSEVLKTVPEKASICEDKLRTVVKSAIEEEDRSKNVIVYGLKEEEHEKLPKKGILFAAGARGDQAPI